MTTPRSAAAHSSTPDGAPTPEGTSAADGFPAADGPRPPVNRRQVLVAAGLGAGALTLAACGSSSTAAAGTTSTPTATSAVSSAAVAAPASASAPASSAASSSVESSAESSAARSAAPTSAASSAAAPASSAAAPASSAAAPTSSAAAPAANAIVALSKVPVGGAVAAKGPGGADIIVSQPTAGKVVAFSAICTHMGCTVAVAKPTELDCPCHGSKFNALTGAVINGPAKAPLPAVAVKVSGASIVAG